MDNNLKKTIRTILLVDDNPDHVELFSISLRKTFPSSRIVTASNGEEALKKLGLLPSSSCSNRKPPDAILLDINLPKYPGNEIIRLIKAKKSLQNIPVLVISTSANIDDIGLMLELGADDYYCKSDNNLDLGTKLLKMLQKNKSIQTVCNT